MVIKNHKDVYYDFMVEHGRNIQEKPSFPAGLYLLVIAGFIGFVRKMVQNEMNAIENNNINVIANAFKEKAVLPWYKGTKSLAEGKEKSVFKKAAQSRLEAFESFDDLDKAIKAAESAGDEAKVATAKEALTQACKAFSEGSRLHEIQTRAYGLVVAAGKADPLGQTPQASLGIGLELNDLESFNRFKAALLQSVIWASRQVKNEAAQAAAKTEAEKKAKFDIEEITSHVFEDLQAWRDSKASDKEILKDVKTVVLRTESLLRAELRQIEDEGSGSTARAYALLDFVEDEIRSELEQMLSDSTLRLKDRDGSKIWQTGKILVGTTARKIIEAAMIKLRAIQSKADRSLDRLHALEGAAKITW